MLTRKDPQTEHTIPQGQLNDNFSVKDIKRKISSPVDVINLWVSHLSGVQGFPQLKQQLSSSLLSTEQSQVWFS